MRTFILTLLILWSLGSWWYYACHVKNACWETPTDATTPTSQTKPLLFRWSSYAIPLDSGFPDLIEAILASKSEDKILQLTGSYYPTENSSEVEDLGFARASEVKKLLLEHISEDRIRIASEAMLITSVPQDSLIQAVHFEWVDADGSTIVSESNGAATDEVLLTTETEDHTPTASSSSENNSSASTSDYFVKYFPYSADRMSANQNAFLDDLANRLMTNQENILIRGHTDSEGDKEQNFKVGLRRAKKIRDLLMERGVPRKQIETTSQGEDAPIATNDTQKGREKNRRIELFIK